MDEFQLNHDLWKLRTFETKFSGNYGEALTKGSVNYNHLQSDGFRQIPLMIENHSHKANKDKRQR
jgi:hypothetical protein